jgi:GTP cyclohydrolase II
VRHKVRDDPSIAVAPIRTKYGESKLHVFSWSANEQDNVLVVVPGELDSCPLIRIQSACYTGEIFDSLDCDCHWQLETSLKLIHQRGGAFIYMLKDGRGAGLLSKIRGMKISSDEGVDTAEAYQRMGIQLDPREYSQPAFILKYFGIERLELLTNNPRKITALANSGFKVSRRALVSIPTTHNRGYLEAKAKKLGHLMQMDKPI